MFKLNSLIEKSLAFFAGLFTISFIIPFFLHAIIDNQSLLKQVVDINIAVLFISIVSFLMISMVYGILNLLFSSKLT